MLRFSVLGPLEVTRADGEPVRLGGPRHRAVLARLLVTAPRVVPVQWLIDDLWDDTPPDGALGALQTFVGALRKVLEPDRAPRTPSQLLVTQPPGYVLRPRWVDAWQFADEVQEGRRLLSAGHHLAAFDQFDRALRRWRGTAWAGFEEAGWARRESRRLEELRSLTVEVKAEAGLVLGRAAGLVPELEAHVGQHPLREDGWRLLALALYRTGRQADALAALRRARGILSEQLGIEPGPALQRLESDVLRQDARLDLEKPSVPGGSGLWRAAVRGQDPTTTSPVGRRERLDALMGLVRALAVTGELAQARQYRGEAVRAAAELADPLLFAQVVGAFEVPAIWTANDDEELSGFIVESAEQALAGLPPGSHPVERTRLLITIALERRADPGPRGLAAAREAEALARRLADPGLLTLALNGRYLQTFSRAGLAGQRALTGHEILEISAGQGAPTGAVLGHLILLQSYAALGELPAADRHAAAADELAERYGIPLIGVFTAWYRALRLAITGQFLLSEDAYRLAFALLPGSGMPGVENGIVPLARLCLDLARGGSGSTFLDDDFGPYQPWATALAQGGPVPVASPRDLLFEARTGLAAAAALRDGDRATMKQLYAQLLPAEDEIAGAGSGMVTLGPVARWLGRLAEALGEDPAAERHFARAAELEARTVNRA